MNIDHIGIIEPINGLPCISSIVIRRETIYLCGVTSEQVGNIKAQTRQTLERIDRRLAGAGTDKSKLLPVQVWLSDMKLFQEHNSVWNE